MFWLGGRADNQDYWVRHSLAVRGHLQMIQSLILRAESSQRGYLVTSREDYVAPFAPAAADLQRALDEAAILVSDNPQQIQALGVLRQLVSEKLAELQRTIDLHKAGRVADALAIVDTDEGRRIMAAIRDQIDSMQGTEDRLLAEREADAKSLTLWLQISAVAVFLLICGTGILVGYFAHRSVTTIRSPTPISPSPTRTCSNRSASSIRSKASFASRRRWRLSANSPAGSLTTSTICLASSWARSISCAGACRPTSSASANSSTWR